MPETTPTEAEADTPAGHGIDWEDYFPYPDAYDEQKDAIEECLETARNEGYVAVEAACGTGKTLISLMAGISLVRDPTTQYERVFVLTSVKQQLRAFEDDLEAINENLDDGIEPITGLTLVGKSDVCSYTRTGHISERDIYTRCDELRDTVKNAISGKSDNEKERELEAMIGQSKVDATDINNPPLEGDDWTAPYEAEIPEDNYCAFYAKHRLKDLQDEDPVDINGMLTPDDLVREASNNGVCPHAAMGEMLDEVEVVVANYYHAFDPMTVDAFTDPLMGEDTFLVCDEAHMIIPRVRELLSDSVSLWTVDRAITELDNHVLNQSNNGVKKRIDEELAKNGIKKTDVEKMKDFLRDAQEWIEQKTVDALDNENPNWHRNPDDLDETVEQKLRNPGTPEQDEFTDWIEEHNYTSLCKQAAALGNTISDALLNASSELEGYMKSETYIDTVGRLLTQWYDRDHETYFRELELDKRNSPDETQNKTWREYFEPNLVINNCIPSEEIANTLDQFGGGILMSATLEPLDVYEEVVGLNHLSNSRPVKKLVYGLNFPEENRQSFAVKNTKFTSSNRGSPYGNYRNDEEDAVRDEYKQVIKDVVTTTDGNVLVCMPSYAEAEWVEYFLGSDWDVDKEVLVDESSSNEETERLKSEFFAGDSKVLVTSLRGTLTEGVDYDGDKLKACVVCGVPIRGLGGPVPTAIETAYDKEFGSSNGFEYAFTVPAVRKARQALGRVIRGDEEKGVRVIADERYTSTGFFGVRDYLPEYEKSDYNPASPEYLKDGLERFWRSFE